MKLSTVPDWLAYLSTLHPAEMDLGLARIKQVGERLALLGDNSQVITVAGTNGKGSTVTTLAAIYQAAGYQTGLFTSPCLWRINEQIKINGIECTDIDLCQAFEQIEAARGDITLTSFEFIALAALFLFKQHALDLWILEVGLGGRLDAVNIIDADVSVVTNIELDHQEWLGSTRELIALEKAGILRPGRPAVYGDRQIPSTLLTYAETHHVPLFCLGRDFDYQDSEKDQVDAQSWSWNSQSVRYDHLPHNSLYVQNMATVLMTVTLMQARCPVSIDAIREGLQQVTLLGRIQIIPGEITHIFDVAHNPAGVALLADFLKKNSLKGDEAKPKRKMNAVFSMLADKDIIHTISILRPLIDAWFIAPLSVKRGASMAQLSHAFEVANINTVQVYADIQTAYAAAKSQTRPGDYLLIVGSFHTVADCMKCLPSYSSP